MVNKIKLACCGDDCSYCSRYTATLSNDMEKLKEYAIVLKKVGWRDTIASPKEIKCFGCATYNEPCEYNIRECCLQKKVENCGECENYTCDRVENAFKITDANIERFIEILSEEEYAIFTEAFFLKKENLDRVRKIS